MKTDQFKDGAQEGKVMTILTFVVEIVGLPPSEGKQERMGGAVSRGSSKGQGASATDSGYREL